MAILPMQVEAFHQAMLRLVAVQEVSTGLKALSSYTPDTYSFPGEFGDLPHAFLRRTGGGWRRKRGRTPSSSYHGMRLGG